MSQKARSQGRSSQGPPPPPDENTKSLAVKAVHFFLAHAGAHNAPVKHVDLKKCVFPDCKVEEPLKLAEKMLKDTFGYELKTLVVSKSTKLYYLTNKLPNDGHLQLAKHTQGYRTLLALILAYIFMNRGPIEQKNLLKFLQQANIAHDRPSPFFGNVADLINKATGSRQDPIFVRDHFLTINETEQGTYFDWGPRAKEEVDPTAVLQFACDVLGSDIRDWRIHLKDIENMEGKES